MGHGNFIIGRREEKGSFTHYKGVATDVNEKKKN